jgi:hypothetical protein
MKSHSNPFLTLLFQPKTMLLCLIFFPNKLIDLTKRVIKRESWFLNDYTVLYNFVSWLYSQIEPLPLLPCRDKVSGHVTGMHHSSSTQIHVLHNSWSWRNCFTTILQSWQPKSSSSRSIDNATPVWLISTEKVNMAIAASNKYVPKWRFLMMHINHIQNTTSKMLMYMDMVAIISKNVLVMLASVMRGPTV